MTGKHLDVKKRVMGALGDTAKLAEQVGMHTLAGD
jgi:hypothetical protein